MEAEDYLAGPVVQGRTIRLLIETLEEIRDHGSPYVAGKFEISQPIKSPSKSSHDTADKLLLTGFEETAGAWCEPNNLKDHMGELYRGAMSDLERVALVLRRQCGDIAYRCGA